MNTIPRRLRHFGAPLLIMLLAATLGWFVQAIGVVAVVFIVVLVKRFGKFESQLAATTFTVVSAFFALAPLSVQNRWRAPGNCPVHRLCLDRHCHRK